MHNKNKQKKLTDQRKTCNIYSSLTSILKPTDRLIHNYRNHSLNLYKKKSKLKLKKKSSLGDIVFRMYSVG